MLGTTLRSHYKIVRFLGIGRSGPTYLAEDRDLPNSALCVIKNIQSGDECAKRLPLVQKLFDLQAEIAANLGRHPQIPTLIAKFEEDGNRYLVREYIAGESLGCELAKGMRWDRHQVIDFLIDLVGILGFVHSFKYIHREIDPHNIIRRSDDDRFVLIGCSQVQDLDSEWQTILDAERTRSTQPAPPCSYIPYEQEQNGTQFNSDLYAVGVIAIQAVTGTDAPARDPDSYEFVWRDGLQIDSRTLDIIDKMVRPDYRDRYRSAMEVLNDLQSLVSLPQLPRRSDRVKPYLVFASMACALLVGLSAVKLLSAAANKSTPIATGTQAHLQTYRDRSTGIALKYDPSWERVDTHNIITGEQALFNSPKSSAGNRYRASLSIRIENLTDPRTTLAAYTQSALAEIARFNRAAKIIESSSLVLAKRPANLVVYISTDENLRPIEHLEVWTIERGKAYIFTYKSEPQQYYRWLGTVMRTIDSVELDRTE